MSMASQPASPAKAPASFGRSFIVGVFIVGAVITLVLGYLGIVGALGGGIVGTQSNGTTAPPPLNSCQGRGQAGSFYFSLVANAKGQGSFNGSSPGPCFAVAVGSHVTMNFSVAAGSNQSNSWALIASTGPVTQPPVFPGAGWSNATATTGIRMNEHRLFTFTATSAGAFRYVSQVAGHAAAGMWGPFNVTSTVLPLTAASAGPPVISAADAGPWGAVGVIFPLFLRSR